MKQSHQPVFRVWHKAFWKFFTVEVGLYACIAEFAGFCGGTAGAVLDTDGYIAESNRSDNFLVEGEKTIIAGQSVA